MAADIPLIWTTKGNLPVSELEHIPSWTYNDGTLQFCMEYRMASGEVVRRDVHVYILPRGVVWPA